MNNKLYYNNPAEQKDWSVSGMTEKEMKSRIKSHSAMAAKGYERHAEYALPSAFLSDSFKTWMKQNPQSPWFKNGGYDAMVKQQETAIYAKKAADKNNEMAYKLKLALDVKQADKLRKQLQKLVK